MAVSTKDLNAQQQAMEARIAVTEARVSAQEAAVKAITAFVSNMPGGSAITSAAPILGMVAGLPGNLKTLVAIPSLDSFKQMGLSAAMGAVGDGIPTGILDGATGVLSSAQASAQAAYDAAVSGGNPETIAAAQASLTAATADVADAAGFTSAAANSASGTITSSIVT